MTGRYEQVLTERAIADPKTSAAVSSTYVGQAAFSAVAMMMMMGS